MDEQRIQAYVQLIEKLLSCLNGQESEILQQDRELIDEGFLQVANYYAQRLKEDGREQKASFLFNLVKQLEQVINSESLRNRHSAYLQLIQSLLQCPNGEEGNILEANHNLIDAGLIETMEQVAAEFDSQRNSDGNWLRNIAQNLVQHINNSQPMEAHLNFLLEILRTIDNSEKKEQIYILLQQNIHLVDDNLAKALQIWTSDTLPNLKPENKQAVGQVISEFSNLIQQFPLRNRSSRIEVAITGYNIALDIFTQTDFAENWATIQNNLGNTYRERIKGDKAENLEQAIAFLQRALTIRTQQDFPVDWAMTQYNMGIVYTDRIKGDKAENLEQAIASYKQALIIRTQQDFPVDWAMTSNNLGIAYTERIKGDKAENLEQAIASYKQALIIRTQQDFPVDWAVTQYNLGIAYTNRIKGNKAENLEQAIAYYERALIIYSQQDFPSEWARTNNNLGTVYRDRIKADKAENLEQAIASYERALIVHSQQDFPSEWARTNNNLGIAYRDRIKGDKAENLEQAISFLERTLNIYTQQDFPYEWARTKNNLGAVYSSRIKGDKAENLEQAIASYERALIVHSQQDFPCEWTTIQNNLGAVYSSRIKGDKAENLEQAIFSLERTLIIYTQQDFPCEWARTKNNLGNAYSSRRKGNRADHLEQAIFSLEQALIIYTQQDFPINWSRANNNLGNIYIKRIKGDKADNLEQAIASYQKTLIIYTQQDFPIDWADTQNNLGVAYSDRVKGDRTDNLETAIASFERALKIRTQQDFPINCLQTARNLGNLHFDRGNWQLAIDAHSIAIEAVEQSRKWATNDQNKQEIISNAIEVYQNIVQACINLGQIDKAIEYVERGKARNLVDLLATRDLYPKGNIPQEVIDRLDSLRQEAIAEEKRLNQQRDSRDGFGGFSMGDNRGLAGAIGNNEALNRDRLNNIRQELDNLVQKDIQPVDPSFQLTQKVEPIGFDKIKASLPSNKTVLIEWFIGKETLSVFIVAAHREQPLLISYSAEEYQVLFDRFGRYLDTYQQRDSQWHNQLDDLLVELAQSLKIEALIEQINKYIPDCDRLILVPHRWMHLLPIHALPLADGKCLLDLFPQGISYAPSVQLLELTQKQSKPQLNNLFAVQNPTEDLEFTNVEVQAVRSHFQPNDDVLKKQQATKSALTKEKLGQANLAHFSCHGKFNFENPELSALLLAGSKIEQNQEDKNKGKTRFLPSRDGGSIDLDKCLTLGEIFSLDLRNCSLVTLSACETGLTDFKSLSDEYIGLPSGFLYAGSPSVVSSLWTVDDISTSFLMIKFYQNLQSIDSVAIALNQAQLWLRSVTKEELEEWKTTLNIGSQMWKIDAALINMPDGDRPYE